MKKRIITVITAVLMLSMALLAEAARLEFTIGESVADVNYNKKIGIVSYLSEQGNTMVGLRAVAETLDIEVEWNEAERKVILSDPELEMTVAIDSDTAIVNGQEVKMTEPARIYKDRTVVPIRFVSESFGAEVEYVEETKSVIVTVQESDEKIEQLRSSGNELLNRYIVALDEYIKATDELITVQTFENVWNIILNTKIMELWSEEEISDELCVMYRKKAGMDFETAFQTEWLNYDNIAYEYKAKEELVKTEEITADYFVLKPQLEQGGNFIVDITYIPSEKMICSAGSPAVDEAGASVNGSTGHSGGGGGSTTALAAPIPPYTPSDNASEVTVKEAEENASEETPKPQATAQPAPEITEGADDDEPSFDDMIDGL